MSATNRVSIDEMANAINAGLTEYANLAASDLKDAVQKTASFVRSEISANAPERANSGVYKKSWRTKKIYESDQMLYMTVFSRNRYSIAHLLEKGHANRNGGRTEAIPHIAPAEERGEDMLVSLIETALKEQ